MPATLVTTQPLCVMAEHVVHAANRLRWNVIMTSGGCLSADILSQPLALYGDWRLVCHIANTNRLFLLAPHAEWLSDLPHEYVGRQNSIITWGDARRLDRPTFVKPIDWKSSITGVYQGGQDLPEIDARPESRVFISEPVSFEYEFRCFVLNNAPCTISPYYHRGESCLKNGVWQAPQSLFREAIEFCQKVTADPRVRAPAAYTLDVGKSERGWMVVEAQPCWFSDIYGCDPERVLQVLVRSCRNQFTISSDDRRWCIIGSTLTSAG